MTTSETGPLYSGENKRMYLFRYGSSSMYKIRLIFYTPHVQIFRSFACGFKVISYTEPTELCEIVLTYLMCVLDTLKCFDTIKYDNRQWPIVVYWVLDTQKHFDTKKKRLGTRSEAECF